MLQRKTVGWHYFSFDSRNVVRLQSKIRGLEPFSKKAFMYCYHMYLKEHDFACIKLGMKICPQQKPIINRVCCGTFLLLLIEVPTIVDDKINILDGIWSAHELMT